MAVHTYSADLTPKQVRARHPFAAIIRPRPLGHLVFDSIDDARGHASTVVMVPLRAEPVGLLPSVR